MAAWRPYFDFKTGGTKYGNEFETKKEAWAQVRKIIHRQGEFQSIDWVPDVKTYGVEKVAANAARSQAQFRVQHVARKPRGWRVRTKREGRHELRIAFPPGPRRTGSGKLLEILHPKGERNPECEIAGKNPAELIIFGNPAKRNAGGGQTAAFAAYNAGVMDAKAGRPPRPQDWEYPESYKKGYARAQTSKKNPRRRSRAATSGRKKNQGDAAETDKAVRVFQTFQGRDPAAIIEKHVSDKMREDYAALGKLDSLLVENCDGEKVKIDFEGDGVLLASSPDATQLYCIGGNQNLEPCLGKFTDDPSKDLLDLGQILEVEYLARKAQGKFEPVKYFHQFGEERRGSELPRAIYDKLRKQVFFAGGEYKIEQPGIIN